MKLPKANVLLVDDDREMLSMMQRRLGERFDLQTADSGDKALQILERNAAFPVIVTDMEMPGMDGVRFIQLARRKNVSSIFVMLTGNIDQRQTVRAMNDGQVFRFLNKPCPHDDLAATIEAGIRQFHLVHAEKQLLQKTLVGAVDAIMDIYEMMIPDSVVRASSVQNIVHWLATKLPTAMRWEYTLASKLSLVGYGLVSRSFQDVLSQPHVTHDAHQQLLKKACLTSARVLQRIPRLQAPAKIIEMASQSDGTLPTLTPISDTEVQQVGATMLRVALEWSCFRRLGISLSESILGLRQRLPQLSSEVIAILESMPADLICEGQKKKIPVYDLKIGMVLQKSIYSKDGLVLISEGRSISASLLEKLNDHVQRKLGLKDTMVEVILPDVDVELVNSEPVPATTYFNDQSPIK